MGNPGVMDRDKESVMISRTSVIATIAPARALFLSALLLSLASQPALAVDGEAVGWGDNTSGKATAPSGVQFRQVSSSQDSSVGIRADGTLMVWGSNAFGEISGAPPGTFTAVSSGGQYHVAIRTDGSLVAWGNGYGGGTAVPSGQFQAVAGGQFWGLGLRVDATLVGWGSGFITPATIPSGSFRAIALGGNMGYAIRTDGTLTAFPVTHFGGSATPPSGVFTAIAAGNGFAVGLRDNGTLAGFGDNSVGQIDVPSGTFTSFACGQSFGIGLRTDGTLVHWGDQANQLHEVPYGQFSAVSAGSYASNAFAIRGACAAPAAIPTQPVGRVACPSGSADFSVSVTGMAPFIYQWQIKTAPSTWQTLGSNPGPLPCGGGATAYATPINSASVTVGILPCPGNPVAPQRFQLRCIVTGLCGSPATSNEATYTICPADFNCSGSLTITDIFDFLSAWFQGDPRTDFDGVNGPNLADIFAFLNAWFAGCL